MVRLLAFAHARRMQEAAPARIVGSGDGQAEGRARALEAGDDEYLIKPVQSDVLLRLIGLHAAVSAFR